MRYVYIPALKGKDVIQYLLGLLGEQELIGTTQIADLNKSINETTNDLADLLNESKIGIGVSFGLPTLLSDFWQQLSVGTTYEYFEAIEKSLVSKKGEVKLSSASYQIPLNMRGDGIKSKFLPPILKWLQNHNEQKTFIWGIDEPENSLEFRAAEELSYLFGNEYALSTQIFATSHSMAFINPRDTDQIKPAIFRTVRSLLGETVFKDINDLLHAKNRENLLDEIGALAIQKELIIKFRQQIEEEKNAKKKLENSLNVLQLQITELTKPLVITEGKTDIKHILKAKEKLGIADVDFEQIDRQHQPDGDSNLRKLLEQLSKIHNRNKIIGIFDRDVADTINKIEKDGAPYKKYGNGVYAFCISSPQSRINNGQTEISIEYLYTDQEITTQLENGCRLFLGTEFTRQSMRHNTNDDLTLKLPKGKGENKVIENNGDQAVYDKDDNNVLAKKDDFAQAVFNDQVEISNDSWENFRHIFDKLREICAL